MSYGAAAQAENEKNAARDLFERGRAAVETRDCAGAIPLFHRSYGMYPARGTLFNLAECEAEVGRVASAWQHFEELLRKLEPGDVRRPVVQQRITELVPRVPKLTVEIAEGTSAPSEVLLDQDPLPQGSLGGELPVDPGTHVLVARWADGSQTDARVSLAEGAIETVHLTLPPTSGQHEPSTKEKEREVGASTRGATLVPPAPAGLARETRQRSWVPVIALGAASAVGLGVGIGMTVASNSANSEARAQQDKIFAAGGGCLASPSFAGQCAELHRAGDRAGRLGDVALGSYIASGVLATAALTYALWPKKRAEASTALLVLPEPRVDGVSFVMVGAW
ncbi:hypothetical protein WME75_03755 [Sorangium sp. So ce1014]|uniref:tetratricopeptide repeat protein n=1 Tax=Sorangium sp. So ce1014 TaxID=3133326 RepID=UPI003F6166CC